MKRKYIFYVTIFLFVFCFTLIARCNSDSTKYGLNGEIKSKKGNTIVVSIASIESMPIVGTIGILSKYFEEEILGLNTHGYIDIGEVEVTAITENEITFSLIKELSKIKVNGKKENHFKKGNIVRFIW